MLSAWWPSRPYQDVRLEGMFNGKLERVVALENPSTDGNPHQQGEFISPLQAVVNCYDMDSFTRAQVRPGADLIKTLQTDASARPTNPCRFRVQALYSNPSIFCIGGSKSIIGQVSRTETRACAASSAR